MTIPTYVEVKVDNFSIIINKKIGSKKSCELNLISGVCNSH